MGWKKGQSGNPSGRPRSGNSLAEAIRRKLDPDEVVEKLWEIAQTSPSEQTRLRALELLMERGFKKPAAVIEVGPANPYEDLTHEELTALKADLRARLAEMSDEPAALLVEGDACDAQVLDDAMSDAGKGARAPSPEADPPETRNTVLLPGVLLRRKTST